MARLSLSTHKLPVAISGTFEVNPIDQEIVRTELWPRAEVDGDVGFSAFYCPGQWSR